MQGESFSPLADRQARHNNSLLNLIEGLQNIYQQFYNDYMNVAKEAAVATVKTKREGKPPVPPAAPPQQQQQQPQAAEQLPPKEPSTGKLLKAWIQATEADFERGEFKGTYVNSRGEVSLAPTLKKLYEFTESPLIWASAVDSKGNLYIAAGTAGKVYKFSGGDSKLSLWFSSPNDLFISFLICDPSDNLYIGAAPSGSLYRVSPDGSENLIVKLPDNYIWSGCWDSENNLYLGTGPGGNLYKIDKAGKLSKVIKLEEPHIRSLIYKNNILYAGTADDGKIFKIDGKSYEVFYDTPAKDVNCLIWASFLYAGTSQKGIIYKIEDSGAGEVQLDTKQQYILCMTKDSEGNIYAGSADNGIIYKISPDGSTTATLFNLPAAQVSAMLSDITHNCIYVFCSNPASIYKIELDRLPTEGSFESSVYDCTTQARWGKISWRYKAPKDAKITIQTRTGNTAEPDDSSWSSWSQEYLKASGEVIASPPAKFIQYRANFYSNIKSEAPKLLEVALYFMPRNQPPKLIIKEPKPGEHWSGKKTIKWEAKDPDNDKLTYQVYYSSDEGKTWVELTKEEKETPPAAASQATEVKAQPTAEMPKIMPQHAEETEEIAEEESFEGFPDEIKEELKAQMDAMKGQLKEALGEAKKEIKAPPPIIPAETKPQEAKLLKANSFDWDTKLLKDGKYIIKVVASDKLSNPAEPLQAEAISSAITIDNKAPKLFQFEHLKEEAQGFVTLYGIAYDYTSFIKCVEWRIENRDWQPAIPKDGMFDSLSEQFYIKAKLIGGEHKVELRAFDAAGNLTNITIKVGMPAAEEEKSKERPKTEKQEEKCKRVRNIEAGL